MKRTVWYSLMALALVLGLTLSISTPVMATGISVAKDTDPGDPDMYYVGDTINYILTVKNLDVHEPLTLTRIWDTFPDGTVEEFIDQGETLVLEPGQEQEFTASYIVSADDIEEITPPVGDPYWGVRNAFEAEARPDPDEDPVASGRVQKISRIIRPNTEVSIEASATTVVSGEEFDLTVTEENTGDVELTNPYVEVWDKDKETRLYMLTAPPDSGDLNNDGILDPNETWSWTIEGVTITETTDFVALGFGTDPLGNEVSYDTGFEAERDEVTVGVELPVGGEVFPVSMLVILIPGLALAAVIVGVVVYVRSRRGRS